MPRFARPLGLAGFLLAVGLAIPAVAMAADPNANSDAPTNVSPVTPTVIDVLANDGPGDASATRPLTIVSVTAPAHGSVRTNGQVVYYDPAACYTGIDSFTYTISDGSGATDTATVIFNIQRPVAAPITDAPQATFVKGSTMGTTMPVRLGWCGVISNGSILQAYRLTESTDGGTTYGSPLLNSTATSATRNAKVNTNNRWQVRTTDGRGQSTATSLVSRVSRFQENSGSIAYSSGWKTASAGKYSGGKERYTTKKGARATLTVSNVRQFAIVASKGPGRGSFQVYVDGVKVTGSAISQKAKKAAYRQVLYVGTIPGNTAATHTIQLRTTSTARVDLDAFVTLSGKAGQSVSFTDDPGDRTYHDDPWTATATAGSGLPVVLALTEASWPVCALEDGEVTFHGTGTCSVVATQYGDPTHVAASVTEAIAVAPAPLTVTGITADDRTYAAGVSSATIHTTGAQLNGVFAGDEAGVTLVTAGATGSFADPSAGDDRTVTIAGLTLSGAKASLYAITPTTTTASIAKAAQTVSFTSTAPSDAEQAGPAYDVAATATSGLTVSFSIDPGSAGVCAIDNGDVIFPGSGSCTVVAGQAGDGNWLAATDATQTFTVDDNSALTQSIDFDPLDDADYGDGPFTLDATASSGLTVAFSSETTAVCTVSGTTLTLVAAGDCTVHASQPGNGTYAPATPVEHTFGVDPKTLTVTGITADDRTYAAGDSSATLDTSGAQLVGVVAGDGAAVTLVTSGATGSFASDAAGIGRTVTITGLTLSGAKAAAYELTQPTTTADIDKASQSISFTSTAPVGAEVGDPDYDVAATATSGLTVSFAIDGASAGVCALAGGDVTLIGEGTCTVIASQGGNANWLDAIDVTQSFDVTADTLDPQTIDFDPLDDAVYGDGQLTLDATASSGLTVAFSSETTAVCTVSGTTLTIVAAGDCTVEATQSGNASYAPATPVDRTFTVDPKVLGVNGVTADDKPYDTTDDATLQFGGASLTGVESGDDVTLVTAGATGTFAGTDVGDDQTVTVTTLVLTGADAASYEVGPVTTTASITKRNLNVTATDKSMVFGGTDPAFTFNYGAFAGSETSAVIDTPPTCGVAVPEREVAGSPYPITCSGGADNHYSFSYAAGALTVTPAPQSVSFSTIPPDPALIGNTYVPAATSSSGLPVTISVQSPGNDKCSIAGGTVTFLEAGTCRVRANQAGNINYQAAIQVQQMVDVTAP